MKIKSILFLIALLPFTFMAIAGSPHGIPTSKISVNPIIAHRGDTANLIISLSNPDEIYNGFQMDLRLPEGISLCKGHRSEYHFELSHRLKADRPSVIIKEHEPGKYRILVFSFNQVAIKDDSGPIITLSIVIDAKMKKGKHHCTLTNVIFNKENNKGTELENVDFVIKVKK